MRHGVHGKVFALPQEGGWSTLLPSRVWVSGPTNFQNTPTHIQERVAARTLFSRYLIYSILGKLDILYDVLQPNNAARMTGDYFS